MNDEENIVDGKKNIFVVCAAIFLCFIFGVSFEVLFGNWLNPLETSNTGIDFKADDFEISKYEYGDYTIIFKSTVDEDKYAEIYFNDNIKTKIENVSTLENYVLNENNVYFFKNSDGVVAILDRSFDRVLDLSSFPDSNQSYLQVFINEDGTFTVPGSGIYVYDVRGDRIRTISLDGVVAYTNNYYLIENEGIFNVVDYKGGVLSILNNEPDLAAYFDFITRDNISLNYNGTNVVIQFTADGKCISFEYIDNGFRLKEEKEC